SVPDIDNAQAAYERALALDPIHIGARVALIDLAVDADDLARAKELLESARRFRVHTMAARDYYMRGILIYSLLGETDRREAMMHSLQAFDERMRYLQERADLPFWERMKTGTFPQASDSEEK